MDIFSRDLARGVMAEARERNDEFMRLRGVINVLADKLARYTGRTVPQEIRDAEAQERRGE